MVKQKLNPVKIKQNDFDACCEGKLVNERTRQTQMSYEEAFSRSQLRRTGCKVKPETMEYFSPYVTLTQAVQGKEVSLTL